MVFEYFFGDDEEVKRSAQLAIIHKRCCVALGYYEDEFIHPFVEPENQIPAISMAYTLRVMSIRTLIDRFVQSFPDQTVQFVNLGAGLDTISFYVLKKFKNVVCFDTDFETQLRLKAEIMSDNDCFKRLLPDLRVENGLVTSERYKMVPFDLTRTEDFDNLVRNGLSNGQPTLFLAEAVFMYIDPDLSDRMIGHLSKFCSASCSFILWEFVNPMDRYGQKTREKFKEQKVELLGLDKYSTVEDHVKRFESLGWDVVKGFCINAFWNLLDLETRLRIKGLQLFNEMEEFGVICSHYMACLALKNVHEQGSFDQLFRDSSKISVGSNGREQLGTSGQKCTLPLDGDANFDEEYFNNFFKELLRVYE